MTTTVMSRPIRVVSALAVTPVLRWAIAVHSVPDDRPWRSACTCGQPLWTGAVAPTGRCTGCNHRIGAPPYAVEAVAGLVTAALALTGQTGWALAAYAWWAATMLVLAFVDLAVLRLPHRITVAASVGFLGLLAVDGDGHAWRRAATAALVLAVLFLVLAVATCGQLGWGDATLAVPIAAALGWHSWQAVYAGTLLGFGSAALLAITLRSTGRRLPGSVLPLGPFLIAAAVIVLAWP
ncbi:prepilin peptidase [Actinoplanes capillaceus]|uniref:Prepilin peptidase n=3 Tax=Actinoplanes campanulatus TaxID=113559 RepID=A0ABQ3WUZ6_9ACTN|nr:prepilin peptidase [Actinoplanes capillaceus]